MHVSKQRLDLIAELKQLCIDYWWDIDTNWGQNATDWYLEDGEFIGPDATYKGHEKIAAFYKWRRDRGDRTVVHSVINFTAEAQGDDKATCHWFLMLYAKDGKPPLPSEPPVQIAYMTDKMVKTSDGWKVKSRKFDNWFTGGFTTNPKL